MADKIVIQERARIKFQLVVNNVPVPVDGNGEENVIETVSINGTNIPPVNKNVPILLKTINNNSLVGTGNITIEGGGGDPEFSQTFTKETILFDDGWIKVPHTESLNYKRIIKNYSLEVAYGNGKTLLTPIIAYPPAETYDGTPYQGFLIRDIDNILLQDSDFETVTVKYDVDVEATFDRMNSWRYDSKFAVLGSNVLNDHSAGGASHSGFMSYIFNQIYTGDATVIESVLDPLCGFDEIPPAYTPTYAKIKEADLIFRPYAYTSEGEQYGSNANILTIASHGTNSFERFNNGFTSEEGHFPNVVCVGSRIDDVTTLSGTTYGYGMDHFEDQAKTAIDYPEFNPNDWNPFYQQSSACAIVAAKFRMIKDATGASWNVCRIAARATAKKTVGGQFLAGQAWDMYRGFGIIQVTDAIDYIRTNYTESGELISALADKIEFENFKYKDQTIDSLLENSPLPKKIVEQLLALKSDTSHRHTGETITPDAVVLTKQYTDAEAALLGVGSIFYNVDQLNWLLKLSDVNYYNFGEELPVLSRIGDNQNHLEGQAGYISGGATQFNNISLASSATGLVNCLATQDVLNTGTKRGYYCYFGQVRDFPYSNVIKSTDNENTWVDGAKLYLCSEAGRYSTTKEAAPAKASLIGFITNRSGANITVMFQPQIAIGLSDLSDVDGAETTVPSGASFIMKLTSGLWKTITESNFVTWIKGLTDEIFIGSTIPTNNEDLWIDPNSADVTTADIPDSTDKRYQTDYQLANKFGIGANYTQFESDGTMKMNGNATMWDDLDLPLIIRTTGAGLPTRALISGGVYGYTYAVNDGLDIDSQENAHKFKEEVATGKIHIHIVTNGVDTNNRYVRFQFEYLHGYFMEVMAGTTVGAVDLLIPANTPDRTHMIFDIGDYTTKKIGTQIIGRFTRVASVGTAPTNNPFVLKLQIHCEIDTVGSRTISAK